MVPLILGQTASDRRGVGIESGVTAVAVLWEAIAQRGGSYPYVAQPSPEIVLPDGRYVEGHGLTAELAVIDGQLKLFRAIEDHLEVQRAQLTAMLSAGT